jgi:hypothetical protein
MSFAQNYPITARKFDTSAAGYAAWELSCEDHGWSPSPEIWGLADRLMVYAVSWYQSSNLFLKPKFTYSLINLRQEYAKMARRTNQNLPPKRAKWQGFLEYRLTEDQLMALDEWTPTLAEIWEGVDALLTANIRVTLSYNVNTKTASCTLIDDSPDRKSGGWGLTSSDADGASAVKAALYKHFTVLEGKWEVLMDMPNVGGRRG